MSEFPLGCEKKIKNKTILGKYMYNMSRRAVEKICIRMDTVYMCIVYTTLTKGDTPLFKTTERIVNKFYLFFELNLSCCMELLSCVILVQCTM